MTEMAVNVSRVIDGKSVSFRVLASCYGDDDSALLIGRAVDTVVKALPGEVPADMGAALNSIGAPMQAAQAAPSLVPSSKS